jgi:hypothetical protein
MALKSFIFWVTELFCFLLHAGFLLRLHLDLEDGYNIFFRKVLLPSPDYATSCPDVRTPNYPFVHSLCKRWFVISFIFHDLRHMCSALTDLRSSASYAFSFEHFLNEECPSSGMWLQPPAYAGSSLADFSTLKMEAIRSSETSVQFTRSTQRHIPEDSIVHSYRRENLRSYTFLMLMYESCSWRYEDELWTMWIREKCWYHGVL